MELTNNYIHVRVTMVIEIEYECVDWDKHMTHDVGELVMDTLKHERDVYGLCPDYTNGHVTGIYAPAIGSQGLPD